MRMWCCLFMNATYCCNLYFAILRAPAWSSATTGARVGEEAERLPVGFAEVFRNVDRGGSELNISKSSLSPLG